MLFHILPFGGLLTEREPLETGFRWTPRTMSLELFLKILLLFCTQSIGEWTKYYLNSSYETRWDMALSLASFSS